MLLVIFNIYPATVRDIFRAPAVRCFARYQGQSVTGHHGGGPALVFVSIEKDRNDGVGCIYVKCIRSMLTAVWTGGDHGKCSLGFKSPRTITTA